MSQKELEESFSIESSYRIRQQRFAYPSSHAAKRIAQRTSMNILELMSLLDNGVCVNIGQYAGSYRRHLLFFSPKDNFCYVAIQDERYGKIITVLPPAYHRNLAWRINAEQYQLAKKRHESYTKAVAAAAQSTKNIIKQSQKSHKLVKYRTISATPRTYKIWVQALYISEFLMAKRTTLFKTSVDYYIDDFEKSMKELLKDPIIYEKIDNGIKSKRLFQDDIYALCFRQKKDGSVFYTLTLRNQYEAESHVKRRQKMQQYMEQLLFPYISSYIALPAPTSMRLLRLHWNSI